MAKPAQSIVLDYKMAPGDVLLLTALVRDIKATYGDRYQVDIRSNFPGIWHHNPHLTPLGKKDPGVRYIDFASKLARDDQQQCISRGNTRKRHYLSWVYQFFERQTGIHVPILKPHGDIHLSEEERRVPYVEGRYWVVVAGGKSDMTTKIYSQYRTQLVVDRLREWGLRFVQEGAIKGQQHHPPLERVLNLVGTTGIRDLIRNIYHAEGVLCTITFPMHIAGALERPCVVWGGGREAPWWEAYVNDWDAFGAKASPVRVPHRYLHTLGLLDCCQNAGCWKKRVVLLGDGKDDPNSICKRPVYDEQKQPIPECLELIKPEHICNAVMSYYEDGYLPPPRWSVKERNLWRQHGRDQVGPGNHV